jgi:hypothetical protein
LVAGRLEVNPYFVPEHHAVMTQPFFLRILRRFVLFTFCILVAPLALHAAGAKLREYDAWDVAQIKGQRLGYCHTTVNLLEESGRQVAKVHQVTRLSLPRFGQETSMEIDYSDTETLDCVLLDFELVMKQEGATPMRTTGKVVGQTLEMQIESQGQKLKHSIPWPAAAGGLLAPELSLLVKPLSPGEKRTLEHLNFDNQSCTTELTAEEEEMVALLGGSFRLLKIGSVDRMAPNAEGKRVEIPGAVWTNSAGEMLKTWAKPMDMETLRVTKEVALTKVPLAKLDLGEETLVKVQRPIPHAHDTRQIRYRIHIDDSDPTAAFPVGPSQHVQRIDDHTALVTVRAIRPDSAADTGSGTSARADAPTDADRKPNNFIQSDDPLIVTQAKEAAGEETDPWKVAVALERYVHRAVTMKDFSQALATAADVARSKEGDCTEHAVYLAALARARNIPARVAIGLVYMPQAQTFGYHMWTELYIAGRWIGMDATLAKGGIGGGHLRLTSSPLAGAAAYNSFLPVMQVIGRLKVDVIDWQ